MDVQWIIASGFDDWFLSSVTTKQIRTKGWKWTFLFLYGETKINLNIYADDALSWILNINIVIPQVKILARFKRSN